MEKTYLDGIVINADSLVNMEGFNYDTRLPLQIYNINQGNVMAVKNSLINIIGGSQEIKLNGNTVVLDDLSLDSVGEINISPMMFLQKQRFNFIDLYLIFKALRSENGCEWDKAQTHESIRQNVLEEAYELVEAINNKDIPNMTEETGDLLLQAIFHAVIGEQNDEYNLEDTVTMLCKKLITRHTHIFGEDKAQDQAQALVFWEKAKEKEKKYTNSTEKLQGIAKALPSLIRAKKVIKIANKLGISLDDNSIDDENAFGNSILSEVKSAMEKGVDCEVALTRAIDRLEDKIKESETNK